MLTILDMPIVLSCVLGRIPGNNDQVGGLRWLVCRLSMCAKHTQRCGRFRPWRKKSCRSRAPSQGRWPSSRRCGSPAPPPSRTDYRSVSSSGSLRALFVLKLVSEEVCSLRLGIFHAWSLKIMLMVGDHVFFIPRRIRLSICERDIALPTEVRIACAVVSF